MDNSQRKTLVRTLSGYILLFLILRFVQHATPSRLLEPPLHQEGLDITYWIFQLLNIPAALLENRVGTIVFDVLLFFSGILCFIFPLKRRYLIPFSIGLFAYALAFNRAATHHTHALAGVMIVLWPFWAASNQKCYLLWQGVRYYCCYVYGMSFLWKIRSSGSFYFWQQGTGTFKMNLADYLYHNPSSLAAEFYRLLLRHDWVLNGGATMIFILEGLMILGFFTKRWDKILFWFPVTIHLATYFFTDVMFFELLVLDFAFLSLKQIDQIRAFGRKALFIDYWNAAQFSNR
jgi:hypothetical protein